VSESPSDARGPTRLAWASSCSSVSRPPAGMRGCLVRHRSARRPLGFRLLRARAARGAGQHRSIGVGGQGLVVAGAVLAVVLMAGLAVRGVVVGADGPVPGTPGASQHGSASHRGSEKSGRERSGTPRVQASTPVSGSTLSPMPTKDTRSDDASPQPPADPEPDGVGSSTEPTAGSTPTASQEPTPTPRNPPEDEPSEEPSLLPTLP
jgi:hypothetical protein